jgi:hypothetical protein
MGLALLAQVVRLRRRDTELLFTIAVIVLVIVVVGAIAIAFLSALVRVFIRVQPEHRRIEPGQIWLNLVPVFNFVWATVTVERIAESLRNEFMARSLHGPDEWYGRKYGITTLILAASGVFLITLYVVVPLGLIYGIAYWRQINRYAERLKAGAYAPPPIEEGW